MVCIRVRDARAWWYWDHCLLATGRGGDEPPGQKAESPMSPAGKEGLPALLTLPGGTDLPPQNTSWGARLGTRQRRGATLPLALESLWSRKEQKKGFLSKSYREDWEISYKKKTKQLFGIFRCHPEQDPQHLLQPGEAFEASESRSDHLQRGVSSPPSPKRCCKV